MQYIKKQLFTIILLLLSSNVFSQKDSLSKEKVIQEVVLTPKKFRQINIGSNSKSKLSFLGYKEENINKEYAIKIENKKFLFIKNINFNIASYNFSDSVKLTITFYKSNSNGEPSNEILYTFPLIIKNNDIINNKFSVDVSDKKLIFLSNFFIAIKPTESINGSISLSGNIFNLLKSTYYRDRNNNWKKIEGIPAINIDVLVK